MNKPMEKPIVFFSHSSKDEKPLKKLKALIDDKTKGSVIIFMTSDGQSIPFGRNWVYKVEEALDNSSLMFVFISPNSLQSNWIYFEAGYAYSKDIKVVPLGILGVDLGKTKPPLSLLQGFNLDNPDTLENIIAIINDTYDLKCDTAFEDDAFDFVFQGGINTENVDVLSQIQLYLDVQDRTLFLDNIKANFERAKLECITAGNDLFSNGFQAAATARTEVTISIDGILAHIYLPIIQEQVESNTAKVNSCLVLMNNNWSYHNDFLKRTALVKDTEIRLADQERFVYKDIPFRLYAGNGFPVINTDDVLITAKWLTSLLRLLVETEVIYKSQMLVSI
jgi:hypothetical protein